MSKMEAGDRRLDLVQLRTVCRVLGITLPRFVARLEGRLAGPGSAPVPPGV